MSVDLNPRHQLPLLHHHAIFLQAPVNYKENGWNLILNHVDFAS